MDRIGPYEIRALLGTGGMGTVHLGSTDEGPRSRTVAIKRVPAARGDETMRRALADEARLSSRIRHVNIARTMDVVVDGDALALVMEYVHGETFETLLRSAAARGERCPPAVTAAIVHGVLLGLHAAHEATAEDGSRLDIIHRDVSPQNILVSVEGIPKLIDFGIAKARGRESSTREGQVKGKVAYMAPETLRLEATTRRVDVYAAGLVLWEALAGRRLFVDADSEGAAWAMVLTMPVPKPSEEGSPVPELDPIVMRALDRDPAKRFATALDMASELERATPLASPAEVAVWVRSLAAESLDRRTRLLTAPRPARERASTARRWRRWLPAVALGAVPVVVLAASEPTPLVARSELGDLPAFRVDLVEEGASVAPPPTGVIPGGMPAPKGTPRLAPRTTMRATSAPATRPPRDPCDPPFTVDATGKHYKVECLRSTKP